MVMCRVLQQVCQKAITSGSLGHCTASRLAPHTLSVMSLSMKYLLFALLLYSGFSSACIVGPVQIPVTLDSGAEYNFSFKSVPSPLCDQCTTISVTAPIKHKEAPFSHGIFTVYFNEELVSRSVHTSRSETGVPEFMGIVHSGSGYSYELTFEYGEGRCMQYQFLYRAANHRS